MTEDEQLQLSETLGQEKALKDMLIKGMFDDRIGSFEATNHILEDCLLEKVAK